jgi:hypothetical protein
VAVLVLAGATHAMAANDTVRQACLLDRPKDRPKSPIVGVDLNSGSERDAFMQGAEARGKGWSCRYVAQWQQQ